jgi:hypothetical protein
MIFLVSKIYKMVMMIRIIKIIINTVIRERLPNLTVATGLSTINFFLNFSLSFFLFK